VLDIINEGVQLLPKKEVSAYPGAEFTYTYVRRDHVIRAINTAIGAVEATGPDLNDLYARWVTAADELFGPIADRRLGVINHLIEEVDELDTAVSACTNGTFKGPLDAAALDEAADVFMLLAHATSDCLPEFLKAIEKKIEVCRQREWLPEDSSGVRRHKKSPVN
jgi:hypothetical protein